MKHADDTSTSKLKRPEPSNSPASCIDVQAQPATSKSSHSAWATSPQNRRRLLAGVGLLGVSVLIASGGLLRRELTPVVLALLPTSQPRNTVYPTVTVKKISVPQSYKAFVGEWGAAGTGDGGLQKLVIWTSGASLHARATGICGTSLCSMFGEASGEGLADDALVIQWTREGVVVMQMRVQHVNGGQIRVTGKTGDSAIPTVTMSRHN